MNPHRRGTPWWVWTIAALVVVPSIGWLIRGLSGDGPVFYLKNPIPADTPLPAPAPDPSASSTRAGVVEVMTDGSLLLDDTRLVRLLGVRFSEPATAAAWLEREAKGREIRIESIRAVGDAWEAFCWVSAADGDRLLNEEALRQGLGSASFAEPGLAHEKRLLAAPREARDAGRGVWSQGPR